MLNKCKVNMKRDLENSITNYNESVLSVHQVGRRTVGPMYVRTFDVVPQTNVRVPVTFRMCVTSSAAFREKNTASCHIRERSRPADKAFVLLHALRRNLHLVISMPAVHCPANSRPVCAYRVYQDASTHLPYSGDLKPEKAFEIIEEYKAKVEAVRATQVMAMACAKRAMRTDALLCWCYC